MYQINTIVESWMDLIGWEQHFDPSKEIESYLTTTESGMYYQQEHPYLTLDNLFDIMPKFTGVTFQAWNNSTTYQVGNKARDNGINYEAIRVNTDVTPSTSSNDWKVYDYKSDWLKKKTTSGIIDLLNTFIAKKEINRTAKSIIENRTLFDNIGQISNTQDNRDRRVGFEVVTTKSVGFNTRVDKIALQFSSNCTVTIQLHHSSQKSVLNELELTYNKNGGAQWFVLNWNLPYLSDNINSGGAYYITYKQSQIEAQSQTKAIVKEKDWRIEPPSCCSTLTEINTWKLYSPLIEFHPFEVPNAESNELWDVTDNRYSYTNNFGINMEITLMCDYTEFFVKQRDIFKNALRKQVAINLLRELAYNPNSRINQKESTVTREQLIYEIDGDTRGRDTSMNTKYNDALDAIMLNTQGLSRLCLPCKTNGIKYGAI